MTDRDHELKGLKPSRRRLTAENAMFMCIEFLIVSSFVLLVLTLVAGRYPHALQTLPFLTFDTSSVHTHLVNQGISTTGKIGDWYEPHYLSVCKGSWLPGGTRRKNASSTVCMAMDAGYTFSLPQLLAADAGIPADSPLLSFWSFAILNTKMGVICLILAITFINWTWLNYLFCLIKVPHLTSETRLLWHRVGYLASVAGFVTTILSSIQITVRAFKVLNAEPVKADGVAWTLGGFYVLIWLTTGLLCVSLVLSIILAFRIRPPMRPRLS